MQKKNFFKKVFAALCAITLLAPNYSMVYAQEQNTSKFTNVQKEQAILLESKQVNQFLIDNNINVINQLKIMKDEMIDRLETTADEDIISQIKSEIKHYDELVNFYTANPLPKTIEKFSRSASINATASDRSTVVKSTLIAAIAAGKASGLALASELLSHSMNARTNSTYTTTTRVFDIIMSSAGTSMRTYATEQLKTKNYGASTARFAAGAGTTPMDLYLALHRVNYSFTGTSASKVIDFTISDYYDFEKSEDYFDFIGRLVNVAVEAYELGIIKYYYVKIPFQANKI